MSTALQAARDVVERVLGADRAARLDLVLLDGDAERRDSEGFRVRRRAGRTEVTATTPSALLVGVDSSLHRSASSGTAQVGHRFALNDTDDGYVGPYRSWQDWERLIDRCALHGINRFFVPVGVEAVYLRTFSRLGYDAADLRAWIPTPSHQPWWLLQNMSGFPGPISAELMEGRAALGRRIVARLHELGLEPVLPGYFGTVPPGLADRLDGVVTVPQGEWVGFERPDWLDPRCPAFARVAEEFYAALRDTLGEASYFKMDLLHEGGRAGDVPVPEASRLVQDALERANPGATWVILGWLRNPLPGTLAGADPARMLIVDGLSDRYPDLLRNETWPQTPYAFGSIWNFGGHTAMGANSQVWEDRFHRWRAEPGSMLRGIAVMPEALDNNPAAFDRLTGLAWRAEPTGAEEWFRGWARRRYGAADPAAEEAWRIIGTTAYSQPADGWSEAADSLFCAEPSLAAGTAAAWSPREQRYDTAEFARALPILLEAGAEVRATTAYQHDLVDMTRQVLANSGRSLLPRLKAAYDARDRALFDTLAHRWHGHLALLEELTGTVRTAMLGPWLEDARAAAHTTTEADDLERGCRILLTVWGHRAAYDAGLADYANREWNGLIGTYYAPRWRLFLDELSVALAEDRAPRTFDWFRYGVDWVERAAPVATEPVGDATEVAVRVVEFLG